jgi:hypothetical protein
MNGSVALVRLVWPVFSENAFMGAGDPVPQVLRELTGPCISLLSASFPWPQQEVVIGEVAFSAQRPFQGGLLKQPSVKN